VGTVPSGQEWTTFRRGFPTNKTATRNDTQQYFRRLSDAKTERFEWSRLRRFFLLYFSLAECIKARRSPIETIVTCICMYKPLTHERLANNTIICQMYWVKPLCKLHNTEISTFSSNANWTIYAGSNLYLSWCFKAWLNTGRYTYRYIHFCDVFAQTQLNYIKLTIKQSRSNKMYR